MFSDQKNDYPDGPPMYQDEIKNPTKCPHCDAVLYSNIAYCKHCGKNTGYTNGNTNIIGLYNNSDLMKRDPEDLAALAKLGREFNDQHTKRNDAGEKLQSTNETLAERGNRYGDFAKHADISQELKAVFHEGVMASGKAEGDLPDYIWEAVDMICHKLARVANGDPLYDDNMRDIAGYAELVVKELNKDK